MEEILQKLLSNHFSAHIAQRKIMTEISSNQMHGAITEQNCLVATSLLQLELEEFQKWYKKLLSNNFSADVAQTTSMAEKLHKMV